MATKDQEKEALLGEFEGREAGVAELMEFYEKIEKVYARAAATLPEREVTYTSNCTGSEERVDANMG